MQESEATPKQSTSLQTTSDSSQEFSINDEINDLKNQVEYLSKIYQSERQKYDQAKSRYQQTEQAHKSKVHLFKEKLSQKLQQMSIDNLKKSIEIEEQILSNVMQEKHLQQITMTSTARKEIEHLQKINDEHNYFEKDFE